MVTEKGQERWKDVEENNQYLMHKQAEFNVGCTTDGLFSELSFHFGKKNILQCSSLAGVWTLT